MQFIVNKKKTVISSPARSCFFLQSQFATLQGDNLSLSLIYNDYKLHFFLFKKPNKHKDFKNKLKIIVKKYCSY